jgi:hypothetical protein
MYGVRITTASQAAAFRRGSLPERVVLWSDSISMGNRQCAYPLRLGEQDGVFRIIKVLWREFQADLAQRQQPAAARSPLAQVREMCLAIAQLAEQQMALEGRVDYIDGTVTALSTRVDNADQRLDRADERLDRAAQIVGQLQQRFPGTYSSWGPL